jgi:hypothetical protein
MKKILLFSCALAATVLAFKAFSGAGSGLKDSGTGVRGGFTGDGNPPYAGGAGNGFTGGEGSRTFTDGGEVVNGFTNEDGGGIRGFATDGDKGGNG